MTMRARARTTVPRRGYQIGHLPAIVGIVALLLGLSAPVHAGGVHAADRWSAEVAAGAVADPLSPVFDVSVSRFVGDLVAIGIRQEGGSDTGGHRDRWHLATLPYVDLHLVRDPKWIVTPFVGVAAGAVYDDRRASAAVGPEAGMKLFLGNRMFIAARYQYRWSAEAVGGLNQDTHLATLGIGAFFAAGVDADTERATKAAERAEQAAIEAERAVERLDKAVERLERAVDQFEIWFMEQLRK
jgi:hypothetical protein